MKRIFETVLSFIMVLIMLSSIPDKAIALNKPLFKTQYDVYLTINRLSNSGEGATEIVNAAKAMLHEYDEKGKIKSGKMTGSIIGSKGDWCASFVSCCAETVEQSEAIPYNAGVKTLYNNIKKANGTVIGKNDYSQVLPGDIVFYSDWSHVEIITRAGLEDNKVLSIGGNTGSTGDHKSNYVKEHSWNKSKITAVIRPKYKPYNYTVVYDPNLPKGVKSSALKGNMDNSVMLIGKEEKLPKNAFSIKNYTFKGWTTALYGPGISLIKDGAKVKDLSKESGGTVTLYALWIEDYTLKCTKTNTYLNLKANNSTDGIMTFPCDKKTNKDSSQVRKLKKGEILTATAIYKNTEGNYWYKVTAEDGKAGYVYGGCVSVSGIPSDAVNGNAKLKTTTPKIKKDDAISGTIKSHTLKIKSIKGVLTGSNGGQQTKSVTVNSNKYTINSDSPIDKSLNFAKLKHGPGNLQLTVTLTGKSTDGKTLTTYTKSIKLDKEKFTVIGSYDVKFNANGGTGAPASVKKTDLKDLTLPKKIPKYTGYEFQGWARSKTAKKAEVKAGDTLKFDSTNGKGLTLYAVWKKKATKIKVDTTHFPDDNFREYVKQYDYNSDGYLSQEERESVTVIEVANKNISSMKGVKYFSKVIQISCNGNNLTSLDVSNNPELKRLYCGENNLISLNVSNDPGLEFLSCYMNQLTSLDVSSNTILKDLHCFENQLTSLDVSSNTILEDLYCAKNQLTSLDVSNNPELQWLSCYNNQLSSLDVSNNPKLANLYCYKNQLTSLNVSNCPELYWFECNDNLLTTLDVSNNLKLEKVECQKNKLQKLILGNNKSSFGIGCSDNELTSLSLDGLDGLWWLRCENNQLTELDVSNNLNLKTLVCSRNRLNTLTLSAKNNYLETLECNSNELTNLSLGTCEKLCFFNCFDNLITKLDVSKCPIMVNLLETKRGAYQWYTNGLHGDIIHGAIYRDYQQEHQLWLDRDVVLTPVPSNSDYNKDEETFASANSAGTVMNSDDVKTQTEAQDSIVMETVTEIEQVAEQIAEPETVEATTPVEEPEVIAEPEVDELVEIAEEAGTVEENAEEPEPIVEPTATEAEYDGWTEEPIADPEQISEPEVEMAAEPEYYEEETAYIEAEPVDPEEAMADPAITDDPFVFDDAAPIEEFMAEYDVSYDEYVPYEEPAEEYYYEELPAPVPATVCFYVDPYNAEVHVYSWDGEVWPDANGSYILPSGEYSYTVSADGYEPIENGVFTIGEGDLLQLEITLTPIQVEEFDEIVA